jgi:hypothetical protein
LTRSHARIAARAGADFQRFLWLLNPRLHADDVIDRLIDRLIDLDQKIDRAQLGVGVTFIEFIEQRPLRFDIEIGGQIFLQRVIIGEGAFFGIFFDKEIERIDDHHIGQKIDLNTEMIDRIGKHQPRQPIAMRILLPIQEVVFRADFQRIVRDLCPAVRAGRRRITCGPRRIGLL